MYTSICASVFMCFVIISGGSRISPRRGANSPRGAPTYDFAKISQKLHEIERIWTPREGASLVPPLDPPLIIVFFVLLNVLELKF